MIVIVLHCGSASLLTLAALHGKLEKDIIRHKNSSLLATLHYRHLAKRRRTQKDVGYNNQEQLCDKTLALVQGISEVFSYR